MTDKSETKWLPPNDERTYYLVRLAYTLHPLKDQITHYKYAALDVFMWPRGVSGTVVAHDIFPQSLTTDDSKSFKISLKPNLKFTGIIEAQALEAGADINYHKVFPIIQGYGLGESNISWGFVNHPAHPLQGCQCVYGILDSPKNSNGIRLHIILTVTVENRLGPFRLGLPEDIKTSLRFMVIGN